MVAMKAASDNAGGLIEELQVRVLALDPDNPTSKSFLAWQTSDMVAAARLFEEAAAIDPTNQIALLGSADLAASIGKTELAIRISEYLVARDPLFFWAHLNLAGYYFQDGRIEDALRRYKIAVGLNPIAGAVRWKTGLAKLVSGDPVGALAEFEIEEGSIYRLHGLALAYHDLGREEESAAAFLKMVESEGEVWPYGLARAYAWVGDVDEAFRYLQLTGEKVGGAATNPLFQKLQDDPRWLPFLRSVGQAPEQLVAIEFNVRPPD
jgi:tetratricopeptide (TPR) repeat protein